ncbi:hypothetical protein HYH02_005952 [Chlamydomonas schloesseri]|uniref:O-fucosyltransferase family protein n=1 Tax=Chlamydomonas schloesseri TaxID=2026947 RepID=A0A835WM09_9CHLO|nr:hypothetical protein HYH02_005952 [Chlamydomonas schloesseri]|eukprot:KAG2449205.1 hypothetical protein HYH02_005952 [Chlamydomonas schloesseri]
MRVTGWKRGVRAGGVLPGPTSPAKYGLYLILILVGYLAGSALRGPYGDSGGTQRLLISAQVSTTTAAAAADSGETTAAADGRSSLPHLGMTGRLLGGGFGKGGSSGQEGGASARRSALHTGDVSSGSGAGIGLHSAGADGDAASSSILGDRGSAAEEAAAAAAAALGGPPLLPPANRTLRFGVCNGYANQRLAVLYGMLLARRLSRSAVLPVLIDNGLQRSDANVLASGDNQVPFSQMYDEQAFIGAMESVGVRALTRAEAPAVGAGDSANYRRVELGPLGWSVVGPLGSGDLATVAHLEVDCPLFKLQAGDLQPADEQLVWSGLAALRPSKEAASLVDTFSKVILTEAAAKAKAAGRAIDVAGSRARPSAGGGGGGFNYIHLRVENDWVEHCARWESIHDGIVRDNCFNHTDPIASRLALFGFSNSTALYVATYWRDVEPQRRERVVGQLEAAGYILVTSDDVLSSRAGKAAAAALAGRGREFSALVEYFLGMRAERFIGNSVSTFAALGMLERRHAGLWGAYYNGGNIPLVAVLPFLHKMPWVFTYNSWSKNYEYMLKAAVRSARYHGSLKPYCIFTGDEQSDIYAWLAAHDVTLISHTPAWTEQLLALARAKAKENVHHSHLFKTPDMLVATFQRVDLPVVPILDQYTYVLYTDADVFFRRPLHLDDFGLPLPHSVSMSYEFVNMFPYNAGVILANLPTMRQNYDAFVTMMLDNNDGLYYTNYGPADQGIINKFYEKDLRQRMLDPTFNTKPYNPFEQLTFILHFHGPKPMDLLNFVTTGKCDFFTVCENAFLNSLCPYTREWAKFVPDEVVAVQLEDACAWLDVPNVAELFKKKWGLTGRQLAESKEEQSSKDAAAAAAQAGAMAQQKARLEHALELRRKLRKLVAGGKLSPEVVKALDQPGPAAKAAAMAIVKKLKGGKGKIRGGASQNRSAQQQQQQEPKRLESFDTANVVTVDEKEMEDAWGAIDAGGAASQQ